LDPQFARYLLLAIPEALQAEEKWGLPWPFVAFSDGHLVRGMNGLNQYGLTWTGLAAKPLVLFAGDHVATRANEALPLVQFPHMRSDLGDAPESSVASCPLAPGVSRPYRPKPGGGVIVVVSFRQTCRNLPKCLKSGRSGLPVGFKLLLIDRREGLSSQDIGFIIACPLSALNPTCQGLCLREMCRDLVAG
jgi:hypothetical protein